MNVASKALLPKVARIVAGRALHRPLQRSLFSSAANARYLSLSVRLAPPVDSESFHTTSSSNADFPVDIIDRQQSLHLLSTLIKQGDVQQARQTLAHILESTPANGDLEILRQMQAVIVPPHMESPPVDLIFQLGSAAVSRGHFPFASNEILPLLERFGAADVASQLYHEIREAESSQQTLENSNEVFEGASDDYAAILSESRPVRPASAQDLMLQQLPALLPDPDADNSAVFEDEDETAMEQMSLDPLLHTDKTSIGMLREILLSGKLNHAYQFLQGMLEMDVQISPHPIYAQAALSLLKAQDELPPGQMEECKAWFDLVPPFNVTAYRAATMAIITEAMNILLRYFDLNIDAILHITLVLTSKGYSPHLSQVVEVLVSFLTPTQCSNFVESFQKCEADFFSQSGFPASLQASRNAEFLNTVVQTLVFCHRRKEANMVVDTMKPSDISEDTKKYLLNASKDGKPLPFIPEKFKPDPAMGQSDVVGGMRYLKQKFNQNTSPPNPLSISDFMAHYIATGRTYGLELLARKAFRCNRGIISSVLLGEMILYKRMGLPDLILETFVENFYLYDVPEELVLKYYKEAKARRQAETEDTFQRIINPNLGQDIITRKLWPQSSHHNLIWEVLLQKATSAEFPPGTNQVVRDLEVKKAVVDLFQTFLEIMHSRPQEDYLHPTENDNRHGSFTQRSQFVASSFTPFFRTMMHVMGPQAGKVIFNKMLQLGITPSLHSYSELAGQYARYGRKDEVFDIIHRLEAGGSFKRGEKRHLLPEPDFIFYVNLIRGFIIHRDPESAKKVREHLEKMFPDAESLSLNEAQDDLNQLETMGSEWIYQRRHLMYPKPYQTQT